MKLRDLIAEYENVEIVFACLNGHETTLPMGLCPVCGAMAFLQVAPHAIYKDRGRSALTMPEGYHDHLDSSLTARHDQP